MASNFSPKSGSSGSPRSARSGRSASGSSARSSSRATKSSAPVSGKRKSIGEKAKRSSKRAAERARSSQTGSPARSDSNGSEKKAQAGQAAADGNAAKKELPKRGDGSQTRSRRIGDIRAEERRRKREERARRARAKYRTYILRIVGLLAAALLVFFGAIFIYRSSLFHIEDVRVDGTSHLTSQEVTELAAVPDDATLLRVDTNGIAERLMTNAWVQEAHVHRSFPSRLTLTIVERTPGAVVKITDKKTWVISTDGSWLSAANAQDWKKEMRIVDVSKSLAAPVSGSDCGDGGIKNALAVIEAISPKLKEQIKSISAESSVKTSLNLENGVTVAFGDSNDVDLKEADIWSLLEKYEGKISYINVRVPSHPTFRTQS